MIPEAIRRRSVARWLVLMCLCISTPLIAFAAAPGDLLARGKTTDLLKHLTTIARPTRVNGEPLRAGEAVYRFYRERDFQPAWTVGADLGPQAGALRGVIAGVRQDGLRPNDYHLRAIEELASAPGSALQRAQLELLLSDAFLSLAHDLRQGRVDPRALETDWHIYPADYNLPRMLAQALAEDDVAGSLAQMPPPHRGYARLRDALFRYERIEAEGGWPQLPSGVLLERGVRDPRVPLLRQRLRLTGDLTVDQDAGGDRFDTALDRAVRRYQRRNGLRADGDVGPLTLAQLNVSAEARVRQLRVNMERWRWLPRVYAPRYVRVNMAGFRLQVVEGRTTVMSMPVIIGRDHRQTPAFKSHITALVLNPYWYVPETVLREDVLPALRRDPGYLARTGLQVFERSGSRWKRVDPTTVDWHKAQASDFPYILRQAAGPENALGRVKFMLPNDYGIYLHDTPHRWLFERPVRAFSSGCIRIRKPVALAAYLLRGQPEWDRRAIEAAIATGRPQHIDLAEPIPIYLVYWTAWVGEEGRVNFRNDIYGRDSRVAQAMRVEALTVSRRN